MNTIRGEGGGARAGDDHPLPPPDGQESPVPLGGPEIRSQRDVPVRAERRGQRGIKPSQIGGVGDDQQGPATGQPRRGRDVGQPCRPVLTR